MEIKYLLKTKDKEKIVKILMISEEKTYYGLIINGKLDRASEYNIDGGPLSNKFNSFSMVDIFGSKELLDSFKLLYNEFKSNDKTVATTAIKEALGDLIED